MDKIELKKLAPEWMALFARRHWDGGALRVCFLVHRDNVLNFHGTRRRLSFDSVSKSYVAPVKWRRRVPDVLVVSGEW